VRVSEPVDVAKDLEDPRDRRHALNVCAVGNVDDGRALGPWRRETNKGGDRMNPQKKRLDGKIVTMDKAGTVIAKGSIFVDGTDITAVQDAAAPVPAGFETVPAIETGGTIYPGLFDLHNHLSYNALKLWNVPKKFGDRSQWPTLNEYHQLVVGPMAVLGHSKDPTILPSLVRYVEAKCLVAGVTTSQGIALSSAAQIVRYYKGIVRNVESPDDARLPSASTHIADVAASSWTKFDAEIQKPRRLLLHLAEGKDPAAEKHFASLKSGTTWAISHSLVGIHSASLSPADFKILAAHGGSMVWSPLSNYLLYGATADVKAAKAAGVLIGLGPDWSPTGSKNLLAELKVAQVVSKLLGDVFTDEELVRMVTSTAAQIVNWDKVAGSIEKGKVADLLVIAKKPEAKHEYDALITSRETDIALVVIRGVAHYGTHALMEKAGITGGEKLVVGGKSRIANFDDTDDDPEIAKITLADAEKTLKKALANLGNPEGPSMSAALATPSGPKVALALDEQEDHGFALRPHLMHEGVRTGLVEAERTVKSVALKPLKLDALTTVDDPDYVPTLMGQMNLPQALKDGLKAIL
jgi:5-methylthioadenosine/S-adenosylhomocysteine deaminase